MAKVCASSRDREQLAGMIDGYRRPKTMAAKPAVSKHMQRASRQAREDPVEIDHKRIAVSTNLIPASPHRRRADLRRSSPDWGIVDGRPGLELRPVAYAVPEVGGSPEATCLQSAACAPRDEFCSSSSYVAPYVWRRRGDDRGLAHCVHSPRAGARIVHDIRNAQAARSSS